VILHEQEGGANAFSRLELLACIFAFGLLTLIVLPSLATSHARGDRVRCFNNLRQIGVGFSEYASEHGQRMPWFVPVGEGGSLEYPARNELYIQMSVLSNYVSSPRILVEAGEGSQARQATHWGNDPFGGFMSFRGNSISYFLGLDGNFNIPALLAGDRNVLHAGFGPCATGISPAANLATYGPPAAWTRGNHGTNGNVVRYDGSVEELDNSGLLRSVNAARVDGADIYHLMLPSL